MKTLIALFLCLSVVACAPTPVENPGADAPTYSTEEFSKDSVDVILSSSVKSADYKMDEQGQVTLSEEVKTPQRLKQAQAKAQKEVAKLDAYFVKYGKPFRLRAENGDLELKSLTNTTRKDFEAQRYYWQQVLTKVNAELAARA